jgi:Icc-related predicted phosphoesterase
MRILAFADMHGSLAALKTIKEKAASENVDCILCAGDFTVFGKDMNALLKSFDDMGKPFLLIHGNHEDEDDLRKKSKEFKHIKFIHSATCRKNNYLFFGWGGGGFSKTDKQFEQFTQTSTKEIRPNDKLVLIAHQPPYGTTTDTISGNKTGNKSFNTFIEKYRPDLVICGHIHENFNKEDRIGKTRIINPGKTGMIIEI